MRQLVCVLAGCLFSVVAHAQQFWTCRPGNWDNRCTWLPCDCSGGIPFGHAYVTIWHAVTFTGQREITELHLYSRLTGVGDIDAGTIYVYQGGNLSVDGDFSLGNLAMTGGTFAGDGALSAWSFWQGAGEVTGDRSFQTSWFTLSGGELRGTGLIEADNFRQEAGVLSSLRPISAGLLQIDGDAVTFLLSPDRTYAVFQLWSGTVLIPGTHVIEASKSFQWIADVGADLRAVGGQAAIENHGVFGYRGLWESQSDVSLHDVAETSRLSIVSGLLRLINGATATQSNGRITLGSPSDPSPATLEATGTSDITITGGVLCGTGTIRLADGRLFNGAEIQPGFLPELDGCVDQFDSLGQRRFDVPGFDGFDRIGHLRVEGTYHQGAGGILTIDLIDDVGDLLEVEGEAILDGALHIRCFQSSGSSSEVQVLRAGNRIGTFNAVTPGYRVDYRPDGVWLVPRRTGPLEMTRMSQGDPRWVTCGLGEARCFNGRDCRDCSCLFPPPPFDACGRPFLNQNRIGGHGCVLVSAAMIANCLLNGGGEAITPPFLSDVVVPPTTFPAVFNNDQVVVGSDPPCRIRNNDVVWENVAAALRALDSSAIYGCDLLEAPPLVLTCGERAAWDDVIAGYIWSNVPVAARVGSAPDNEGHTVVAFCAEVIDGVRVIRMADPGNSNLTCLSSHRSVARIHALVPSTGSSDCYTVNAGSPCELMLLDDHGRRTGFDPTSDQEYAEIPGVIFSTEWPNDLDASNDPNPPPRDRNQAGKGFHIDAPPGTVFELQVVGTDFGSTSVVLRRYAVGQPPEVLEAHSIELAPESFHAMSLTIPRECLPCDANCDGSINQFDIQPFIDLLRGASAPCSECAGDASGDASINQFDIQPFVDCLGG